VDFDRRRSRVTGQETEVVDLVVKVFLTEDLTELVLSKHAHLIHSAEHCWALRLLDGAVALQVLDDARWRRGTVAVFESVEAMLGRWTYALVRRQTKAGTPLSSKEQALLAYGLEARLASAATARAFLRDTIQESGVGKDALEIDVVAADPYLRDSFHSMKDWGGPIRVHSLPGTSSTLRALKEKASGNVWIRSLMFHLQERRARRLPRPGGFAPVTDDRRTAALFVLNQRYLDLFQPVLRELTQRGWYVPIVYYDLPVAPQRSIAFADAAAGEWLMSGDLAIKPQWILGDDLMSQSPVSRDCLALALNASWTTASILIQRHRRALEFLDPEVVISFGPEVMSLSLQAAAETLGIPSLFLNHTFREPARSCWFLQATASTMAGKDCLQVNETDLLGNRRRGMVATGHPPYDELLQRSSLPGIRKAGLPGLDLPAERPYLVLLFALWSTSLLGHAMQRRVLQMLIEALPNDAFLVCKVHPSWEERAMCKAVLGAGLPPTAYMVIGESEYGTADLLAACHVAIMHEQSMSLTDAVVMGCPAIAVTHPEFPRGTYSMNHPAWSFKDAWCLVGDALELRDAIVRLTRDEDARHALLRHRRTYIERFLVAADGWSSRRVADLVDHLAAGKDPSLFIPPVGESLLVEC